MPCHFGPAVNKLAEHAQNERKGGAHAQYALDNERTHKVSAPL